MAALKKPPTSIRLSEKTRARLADTAQQLGRSQSGIAELAIQLYIDNLERRPAELTVAEKLSYLRALVSARPSDGGRSTEEIDASIRELRSDRF